MIALQRPSPPSGWRTFWGSWQCSQFSANPADGTIVTLTTLPRFSPARGWRWDQDKPSTTFSGIRGPVNNTVNIGVDVIQMLECNHLSEMYKEFKIQYFLVSRDSNILSSLSEQNIVGPKEEQALRRTRLLDFQITSRLQQRRIVKHD